MPSRRTSTRTTSPLAPTRARSGMRMQLPPVAVRALLAPAAGAFIAVL